MNREIKNNGETISYTSNLVDEILRLTISITTDNEYSVDEVSNLIKTSIPQTINETAGENIRLYHIKDINIIFSKYNNLNLNDPLNEFLKSTSTIVLLKNEWEEQWDSWCTDFLVRIPTLVPKEDNVIQSSNKLTNYLRIVETQFPPIEMYDIIITPTLKVELFEGSYRPILTYDILYVTQSPKDNVNTVKDLIDDSFPFTYDQLVNRVLFFHTNYDIKINVKFKVYGRYIKFSS